MSCEARARGSGDVLCIYERHVFLAAVEQNERSQSIVWVQDREGENLFCFLFSDPIIVGLLRQKAKRYLLHKPTGVSKIYAGTISVEAGVLYTGHGRIAQG